MARLLLTLLVGLAAADGTLAIQCYFAEHNVQNGIDIDQTTVGRCSDRSPSVTRAEQLVREEAVAGCQSKGQAGNPPREAPCLWWL